MNPDMVPYGLSLDATSVSRINEDKIYNRHEFLLDCVLKEFVFFYLTEKM
jgi:hypothetical protein